MFLGIAGWFVVGLIVGFVASKAVNLRGDDPKFGIAAACGGALLAGALYSLFSGAPVAPWNAWSVIFAAVGAVAGAVIWHAVRSRSISKSGYTVRRSY
jgi:uncharacterized membrane protein YeaQ/YmgE (transglycosylase-associated protein family)